MTSEGRGVGERPGRGVSSASSRSSRSTLALISWLVVNQQHFDDDSPQFQTQLRVRVFSNYISNLKCLFPRPHMSARRPRCEHTCQHVSLCTCHSQPVSYTNLCCQRARCASQSTQQAGGCSPAALQPLQISKPLCCFSGASALKAVANKEGSEIEPHTSLRAHQDARCSLWEWRLQKSPSDEMKGRKMTPKKEWIPVKWSSETSEALKFNALLSHITRTHRANRGQLSSSHQMVAGVWCDVQNKGKTEIMPSNLEPPSSNLSLQVRQTQSTRINILMMFPRWVETCQWVAAATIRRSKCSDLMDYPVLLLKPEQELDIVNLQMMHLRRRCARNLLFQSQLWRSQPLFDHYPQQQSSCLVSRRFSFEFGCLAVVTLCSSLQNTPTPTANLSTLKSALFIGKCRRIHCIQTGQNMERHETCICRRASSAWNIKAS